MFHEAHLVPFWEQSAQLLLPSSLVMSSAMNFSCRCCCLRSIGGDRVLRGSAGAVGGKL